jgi:hypothetical protein
MEALGREFRTHGAFCFSPVQGLDGMDWFPLAAWTPDLAGAFEETAMDESQRTMEYPNTGTHARHLDTGELAERRLRGNAYPALQHISCDFRAGVLTLRGRLQVALTAVVTVAGVERIDDPDGSRGLLTETSRARHDGRNW